MDVTRVVRAALATDRCAVRSTGASDQETFTVTVS
jgi:hypothetical protein